MRDLAGRLRATLDILGGVRPLPERWADNPAVLVAQGLWWLLLLIVVVCAAGQNVKFVYIDF